MAAQTPLLRTSFNALAARWPVDPIRSPALQFSAALASASERIFETASSAGGIAAGIKPIDVVLQGEDLLNVARSVDALERLLDGSAKNTVRIFFFIVEGWQRGLRTCEQQCSLVDRSVNIYLTCVVPDNGGNIETGELPKSLYEIAGRNRSSQTRRIAGEGMVLVDTVAASVIAHTCLEIVAMLISSLSRSLIRRASERHGRSRVR